MATLKHINSKNADYGAAEQYLLFEHDEFTMKPVLDETGRLIPREDYRLSTLNCDGEDFAVACMRANLRYQKNQRREDVKSHHYIISFDPRDGPDNGLTVDRAQALGEQFCKEHFPGHQALVCTHPDGHNHSGNIHVHIVINSLRIEEVPFLPYMDRPADTKVGCKHRCTDAALRYFKSEVMEMCHREGLYQIDLLNGSKNRVTDREYWAQKKGQAALDKQNAPMIADSITPRQTKFETNKEKLRQTIRAALSAATSFEDFSSLLLREGVTVKESRGRLSYLTPDRTKPITARKLGTDFDKAAVLAVFQQNTHRAAAKTQDRQEHQPQLTKGIQQTKPAQITPNPDSPQRLVNIAAKRAEGKGIGYERWAKKFNLKRWSQTLCLLQEKKLLSEDALHQRIVELQTQHDDALAVVKDMDARMVSLKELRGHLVVYRQYKPLAQKLQTVRNPAKFKEQHRAEFAVYEAACAYFKANGLRTLPDLKKLDAEYQTLSSEKNRFYTRYKKAQIELRELRTAQQNVEAFFRKEERSHAVPQQEVK